MAPRSGPLSPPFALSPTTWGRTKPPSLLERTWQSAPTLQTLFFPGRLLLEAEQRKCGRKETPLFVFAIRLLYSFVVGFPLARRRHLSSTDFHLLLGRSGFLLVCQRPFAEGLSCPAAVSSDPVKQRTNVYHMKEGDWKSNPLGSSVGCVWEPSILRTPETTNFKRSPIGPPDKAGSPSPPSAAQAP